MLTKRITLIGYRKPRDREINHELLWLGSTFGLFGERDRDKSCFRIFVAIIKSSKEGGVISSDELAGRLNLSRGSVVHHLNKLIGIGLVIKGRRGYLLREDNMFNLMKRIKQDIDDMYEDIFGIAYDIDNWFGNR